MLFWNETGEEQYQLDPEKMKEGMAAWQSWIGNIAMKGRLVSTKPIRWEGAMVSNHGVEERPAIRERQMVTGYLICRAQDMAEVQQWAASCPILTSPAGFTEIREVSPFEM